MRSFLLTTGAIALVIASPAFAKDQGRGGGGGDRDHGQHAQRGGGDRGGEARQQRSEQRAERGNRGGEHMRGRERQRREARGRDDNRGQQRFVQQEQRSERAQDRIRDRRDDRSQRIRRLEDDLRQRVAKRHDDRSERIAERRANPPREIRFVDGRRYDWNDRRSFADRRQRAERRAFERRPVFVRNVQNVYFPRERAYFLNGNCPPGLAKKRNGCLPPGQARQIAAERRWYDDWWRYRDNDDWRYRYNDGYMYRINPVNGLIGGYVPLLGGALSAGNIWPANYASYPVPDYYSDYYGYDDPYDYRYADNAIYSVDPQTNMIEQIAALLTGDSWAIGQRMPTGYDVYNVPYGYRDQYYDTPDAMYRYSDGYMYQMDPTTQVVQAIIQLIT